MLLRDLLKQAAARIGREDAEHLLLALLNKPRSWLYSHDDAEVDAAAGARFAQWLARRESGEPVAYITGRRGFWTFELTVSPATLIPRPETERLVELALARLPAVEAPIVADLGTGSGAIALAIASERPNAKVLAVDASSAALAVARVNTEHLGLGNVELREGDWLAPLAGQRFDLIASNPPYIEAEAPHLAEGDVRFEPRSALVAGADGLDDLRRIVQAAPACLKPGGWLLLEHGWQQGHAVRTLLARAGFARVETARDLENRDRVSLGQWGMLAD